MKKFPSVDVDSAMTAKLERMIAKEAAIAAADLGFDLRPSEFIALVLSVTTKTAKALMTNLYNAKFGDILRIVAYCNHLHDGTNPVYDEVIAIATEAKMRTPK